jgi:hypothetical protein
MTENKDKNRERNTHTHTERERERDRDRDRERDLIRQIKQPICCVLTFYLSSALDIHSVKEHGQ